MSQKQAVSQGVDHPRIRKSARACLHDEPGTARATAASSRLPVGARPTSDSIHPL